MSNKEITSILRTLRKHNIPYKRNRSGHYRVKGKDGWITLSSTPGGGNHSIANAKADLRRHLNIRV